MTPRMRKLNAASSVFLTAAWLTCLYILIQFLALTGRLPLAATGAGLFCQGCADNLTGPGSSPLGYHLSAWGLGYFAILGFLLTIAHRFAKRALFLLAAGGAGASVVLLGILAFDSSPLCPLCILVHVLNLGLFGALWSRVSADEWGSAWFSPRARRAAVSLLAVGVGGLVQGAVYTYHPGPHQLAARFQAAPVHEIPIGPDDPILGLPSAPVRLVVFSSFQCPYCRGFARTLRELRSQFGDQLAVVFKDYPLSQRCNSAVRQEMQPLSCAAAYAAEAARMQGRFWEFHDDIFATFPDASEEALTEIARNVGLDMAAWNTDRKSAAVRVRVALDAGVGTRAGVDGTPSVYLNGRRAQATDQKSLQTLISALLADGRIVAPKK